MYIPINDIPSNKYQTKKLLERFKESLIISDKYILMYNKNDDENINKYLSEYQKSVELYIKGDAVIVKCKENCDPIYYCDIENNILDILKNMTEDEKKEEKLN